MPYTVAPLGLVGLSLCIFEKGAPGQLGKQLGNRYIFGNEVLWEICAFSLLTGGHAYWAKPNYCLIYFYIVVPWGLI